MTFTPQQQVPFAELTGFCLRHAPWNGTPLNCFYQFVTPGLYSLIVSMTNLNATRKFEAKGHDPADPNVWTPIGTVPQFNTFSGLCFAMGAICVPRRSDYWRHNYWTLDILSFSDIMPRNRFSYILQCLHVCDEVDAPAPDVPHTDKINKIRPFINTLVPHLARCASQPESSVLKDWTLPIHSISADTL